MGTANNGLNIVVLDACRNNPFARSWSRGGDEGGLAQITAPVGTFIAYATSPDRTASDGTGRNGLYTAELLKYIKQPNIKIEEAFKQVTIAVDRTSGGKQVPWTSSSLRGEFYFKPVKSNVVANPIPKEITEPTIVAKDKAAQEREAWDLVKNSSSASDFRYYLEEFPDGANAAKAKIRLEELIWLTVRGSDKAKIQAYLNEFPNGANASAARIRLKQLEMASIPTDGTTNNTSRPQLIKVSVEVLADNTKNGWTNSGWVVRKGQRIRISGSGNVSLGNGNYSTPAGLSSLSDKDKLMKNVPTGALIVVIGDDNNEFIYIGTEREFVATRDGALFLGLNEGNLNDNSGAFKVSIEIEQN